MQCSLSQSHAFFDGQVPLAAMLRDPALTAEVTRQVHYVFDRAVRSGTSFVCYLP